MEVVAYFDNILIYTSTMDELEGLVAEVLCRLQHHGLAADIAKCEFHKKTIEFLGYILSEQGVELARDKVQTVLE